MQRKVLVICGLLLLQAAPAMADGLSVTETTVVAGTSLTYEYTLTNNGSTSIIGFGLSFDATVTSLATPKGWNGGVLSFGSLTDVEWVSLDSAFDIPPSGTLSGFALTSPAPPGIVAFSALDEDFNGIDGRTTGPVSPTPEPPAALLLLGGLILLGLKVAASWSALGQIAVGGLRSET